MGYRTQYWLAASLSMLVAATANAADEATFFRGLNLNGPQVVIDGNNWEGQDSSNYSCNDSAFENQNVTLIPATEIERAKMIRSSRYGGNRVELNNIPEGTYTLFLYVWEDNNPETYTVQVNGRTTVDKYNSGQAGHWEKLGPWPVKVKNDHKILLTSQGGAANFSGVELWKGEYDGSAPITAEDLAFFEKSIRPLLVDRCYECHSAESKELAGDLLVDSRATIRRGGSKGPAIVAGDLKRSLLLEAVRYTNEDMQMPPDNKLTEAEIADLERWVTIGAPDPRSSATKHIGKQIDIDAAKQFWSLKPIQNPSVPAVQLDQWPNSEIDRFVLAKQEEQGLSPAPEADKNSLIRRATYDLIGLPPTPEEIDAFQADDTQEAFARVIERLLDSPRYGERWGRHWLDVVRYADTAGDNSDYPIPQIHRYRDWVIEAFNRDLPYDEIVRDQLAGDLRGGDNNEQCNARVIATGYLANSRRFGSRVDDYPQHLTIEDTIDNLGRTFLGMTVSCARCHDHKFDPITARDYYGLYGIFNSTRYPWPGIELDKKQRDFVPLVPREQRAQVEQSLHKRTKEQARLDSVVQKLKDLLKNLDESKKEEAKQQLAAAELAAKEYFQQSPPVETAYAVADVESPEDVAIQIKGDPSRQGEIVPRQFLTVLGGANLGEKASTSGREQLADWILAEDNPLTARVMANRIWQHHFGRGIVSTPNDFGKQGKLPTHPELLDYLAIQFRSNRWSIKSMHRLIMNSRAYMQSASRSPKAIRQDPTNQWLSGFPRQRLDAEAIRDTLLAVAGNLDLSQAGSHPFPPQSKWDFTQHKPFKAIYETNHRSIYLMTQRIQRHPFLASFDGADPSTSTASRMTSTTPLQALYLMNDPLVHAQAQRIASRIMSHSTSTESRLAFAYELLFARPPRSTESEAVTDFLTQVTRLLQINSVSKQPVREDEVEAEAWQACVRGLLRLNEFIYLD